MEGGLSGGTLIPTTMVECGRGLTVSPSQTVGLSE